MGNIKTNDGITPDRRTSGARIKLDTGDWLKIATVIIALILTGGRMQFMVNNHTEALAQMQEKCKTIDKHDTEIAVLKNDIEHIKKNSDDTLKAVTELVNLHTKE